jgi:hypothetical protein
VSHDKVERHEGVEKRDLLVEASPGGHKVVAAPAFGNCAHRRPRR